MAEAYIIDAVRTPVGKRGGGLSGVHPADLSAHVLRNLVSRSAIDPAAVDDVVWGCVDAVGAQAGNIGRTGWLAAGFPEHVPGVTVDRQCGSSQQAVHFAAQAVLSGVNDLVIAGGVQNMSAIPIGSALRGAAELGFPVAYGPSSGSEGWQRRYGDEEVTQFRGAELIAEKWAISRPSTPGTSPRKSLRWRMFRRTRDPGGTPARKSSPDCSRSARAAASPPGWPARSPTARPRCWWPPSARSASTG